MHATAAGRDPRYRREDSERARRHGVRLLQDAYADAHLAVLLDEWQSREELKPAGAEPLLRVHIDAPDQPGTLLDTLESLYLTLREAVPGHPDMQNSVWHALTLVTAGSTARLTIRLAAHPDEVARWNRSKFEDIERMTRQRAIRAAAERRAASLTGDLLGAPEDTVISVDAVWTLGDTP